MGVPYAEVIGDPIAHSKSPAIHRFWLELMGIEAEYRPCLVRGDKLGDYFEARRRDENWRGCNITMPHKIAALEYVHKHRDPSFPVEAINLATRGRSGRLEGVNSDTPGFLEPLLALAAGRFGGDRGPAIVVGGGGVLFSVMWSLSALGYAPIWIVLRDPNKAPQISRDYRGVHGRVLSFTDSLPPAKLLVNATPLGMDGFPPFPLALDSIEEDGLVFDLVYSPLETALLKRARARRLRAIDGLSMLIAQAAIGFQHFFGVPAPRHWDWRLREHLTT